MVSKRKKKAAAMKKQHWPTTTAEENAPAPALPAPTLRNTPAAKTPINSNPTFEHTAVAKDVTTAHPTNGKAPAAENTTTPQPTCPPGKMQCQYCGDCFTEDLLKNLHGPYCEKLNSQLWKCACSHKFASWASDRDVRTHLDNCDKWQSSELRTTCQYCGEDWMKNEWFLNRHILRHELVIRSAAVKIHSLTTTANGAATTTTPASEPAMTAGAGAGSASSANAPGVSDDLLAEDSDKSLPPPATLADRRPTEQERTDAVTASQNVLGKTQMPLFTKLRKPEYRKMRKADLEALLKSRGLPISGTKVDLVARLTKHDEELKDAESQEAYWNHKTPAELSVNQSHGPSPAQQMQELARKAEEDPAIMARLCKYREACAAGTAHAFIASNFPPSLTADDIELPIAEAVAKYGGEVLLCLLTRYKPTVMAEVVVDRVDSAKYLVTRFNNMEVSPLHILHWQIYNTIQALRWTAPLFYEGHTNRESL